MLELRLTARFLTALLCLPLAAAAMAPSIPTHVAGAIDHCAEARQAATGDGPELARGYCGEAIESLHGVPNARVMLDAMAATRPDGASWPWHAPAVLAEQGGEVQDRERFREAWRRARSDADEMLAAHQRRMAGSAGSAGSAGAGERCETRECFARAVAECREVRFSSARAAGARARYQVLGPTDDGACRISLTYRSNPNPDWVDRPLTFVLDPGQPVEPQLEAAVSGCLTARPGNFHCGGPLYEAVSATGESDGAE